MKTEKTVNLFSEALRTWMLAPVLQKIEQMEAHMAADQATLDAAIKSLGDIIAGEDASITAVIAAVNALIAKVQGGATAADLTNEITAINSMASDISTQAAGIQAAVASAKTITG